MGIFEKFKIGFKRSASNIASGLKEIIVKKEIDDTTLDKIEEFLIGSDVGIDAASEIKSIIAQKKNDPKNDPIKELFEILNNNTFPTFLKDKHNISLSVIDLRCLVPLDLNLIKQEVKKSGVIFTVEENPRLCGWGAEISSLIVEQCFDQLKAPITRITTPHIPIPSADILEDNTIPSTKYIVETIKNKIITY